MSATTVERPAGSPVAPAPAPRSTPAGRRPLGRRDLATVLVPCLVAAGLVFYELATRSLWLDEAATVSIASQHGHALWDAIGRDGGNMLGYYLLQHLLLGWFGHGAALIRLPAALATVVSAGLVTIIGRRLFDRRTGFAAGLLAAVSLPLLFWGQNARAYAPMLMFICGSFLALISLVEGRRPRWAAFAYALSVVLAAYMSFVSVLVVPAGLLVLLAAGRGREHWRRAVTALAAAAVACAPIAVLAAERGSGQLFWVPAPDLKRIGEMLRWVTSAGMPPNFHRTSTGTLLLVLTLVLLAAAGVAAVLAVVRRRDWRPALILSWLVVPLVLSLAESLAGQPIALARNSLLALPAVALLLAWWLFARVGAGGPLRRTGPWVALAALIAMRALQVAPAYGTSPENWQAAARYVSARAAAGDCIAFYPLDGSMAFGYYARSGVSGLPASVLPARGWAQTAPFVERYVVPGAARLHAIGSACRRVWLLASHEGQPDGPPLSRAHLRAYHGLERGLRSSYGGRAAPEVKFGWASPVRVRLIGP